MNKFDITELPKQWLVALVALAFTFLLVVPGCAGEAADNGGNGENAAEQAAQVAEEEGPIEAGQAAEDIVVPVSITMPERAGAEPKTIEVTVPDGATVLQATEAAAPAGRRRLRAVVVLRRLATPPRQARNPAGSSKRGARFASPLCEGAFHDHSR